MLRIDTHSGKTLYSPDRAEAIRAAYAEADHDWTYTVEDYGNGWAKIRIEDEDGHFVGYADA